MKFTVHLLTYPILTTLLLSIFASTSLAQNTDIYKWIDEDGRTNYTMRPGNDEAQKMNIGSKTFHKTKSKKNKNKALKRAETCKKHKATLSKYNKAPFLSRYDQALKKNVRLTEEETEKAILATEKDVAYWCNPPKRKSD